MPSDHEVAGYTCPRCGMTSYNSDDIANRYCGNCHEFESDQDDKWYEAFADQVHIFGKSWPDPLTDEEYDECEKYADSKFTRPLSEQ